MLLLKQSACIISSYLVFYAFNGPIPCGLLFSLYLFPFGSIIRKHGLSFHCYADDSQIYVPLRKNDTVRLIIDCLDNIKARMALHFVSFNENKTEVMIFFVGPLGPLWLIWVPWLSTSSQPSLT